jgi:serine/threonine protein kinase
MVSHFGIGSLACYECLDQVGEGTYGFVYKAKDRRTGETVAMKRYLRFTFSVSNVNIFAG